MEHPGLTPAVPDFLAASADRSEPVTSHGTDELRLTRAEWYGVVVLPAAYHTLQPPSRLTKRSVHSLAKLEFDLHQRLAHALRSGIPSYHKPAIPGQAALVCESQKVERLRFSLATARPVRPSESAEFEQPRFVRMKFQSEASETFAQITQVTFCVTFVLEPHHEIFSIPHDDHITGGVMFSPPVNPQD